jgi:DNA end-binding protein Ku
LKSRQHLAAIKPQGKGLMLELMHFPNEVLDETSFKIPEGTTASKPEMKMALQLIDSMSTKWNPEDYKDQYREALDSMITRKLENAAEPAAAPRKKPATNVIDLASVLQRSIRETSHSRKRKASRKGAA